MTAGNSHHHAPVHPGRRYTLLIVLGLLAVGSFLFALTTGSVAIDWQHLWQAVNGEADGSQHQLILGYACHVPSTPLPAVACWPWLAHCYKCYCAIPLPIPISWVSQVVRP